MAERINRKTDEKLYQPAIHSDRVRELHLISVDDGKHMTVHLDKAIREYVENYITGKVEWIEDQSWEEHLEEIETLNNIDEQRGNNN